MIGIIDHYWPQFLLGRGCVRSSVNIDLMWSDKIYCALLTTIPLEEGLCTLSILLIWSDLIMLDCPYPYHLAICSATLIIRYNIVLMIRFSEFMFRHTRPTSWRRARLEFFFFESHELSILTIPLLRRGIDNIAHYWPHPLEGGGVFSLIIRKLNLWWAY